MKFTVKEKISNSFFMSVRILASAWLSFLVSIFPLYIWRATNPNNKVGEDLLMSVVGILFGFLFLMIFQMRDDKSHRYGIRDSLLLSGGGIGIYMLIWFVAYLPLKNNYLIAVLGYHLSCLIGVGADERPTFLASLASALIMGLIYFLAIFVGTRLAHIRQNQFLKDLKKNK